MVLVVGFCSTQVSEVLGSHNGSRVESFSAQVGQWAAERALASASTLSKPWKLPTPLHSPPVLFTAFSAVSILALALLWLLLPLLPLSLLLLLLLLGPLVQVLVLLPPWHAPVSCCSAASAVAANRPGLASSGFHSRFSVL
jgi:hypothetical protein